MCLPASDSVGAQGKHLANEHFSTSVSAYEFLGIPLCNSNELMEVKVNLSHQL